MTQQEQAEQSSCPGPRTHSNRSTKAAVTGAPKAGVALFCEVSLMHINTGWDTRQLAKGKWRGKHKEHSSTCTHTYSFSEEQLLKKPAPPRAP